MSYLDALQVILINEGATDLAKGDTGKVDNPKDPGGRTNFGITQATYSAWRRRHDLPVADVFDCTILEMQALYETLYWQDSGAELCEDYGRAKLALAVFDMGVNMGIDRSRKYLQDAIGVKVDGVLGPNTKRALASCDELTAFRRFQDMRARFHLVRCDIDTREHASILEVAGLPTPKPKADQKVFLNSWLSRMRRVARTAGVEPSSLYAKR